MATKALVPPPPKPTEWRFVFADNKARNGWFDLCDQFPGNTRKAWERILKDPRDRSANRLRVHPLKGEFAKRKIRGGDHLEQWQEEVSGSGRIWYCIDDKNKIVHLTKAGTGHPKETD